MTTPPSTLRPAKKPSSVRHTRAITRDRSKRPVVAPPDAHVAARLSDLIHPLTLSQAAHYYDLGLRERVLTLPVMVALVLSMIWRQIGSVRTVTRLLDAEGFLWTSPVQVSPQALSQRLRVFPAALFKEVLDALLPRMQERWLARQRPCPRRWRGRAGATARCWVWTARRLTRWRARWACCVTGRIRH